MLQTNMLNNLFTLSVELSFSINKQHSSISEINCYQNRWLWFVVDKLKPDSQTLKTCGTLLQHTHQQVSLNCDSSAPDETLFFSWMGCSHSRSNSEWCRWIVALGVRKPHNMGHNKFSGSFSPFKRISVPFSSSLIRKGWSCGNVGSTRWTTETHVWHKYKWIIVVHFKCIQFQFHKWYVITLWGILPL